MNPTAMLHLRWVDCPPPAGSAAAWGTVPHELIAETLRANPGRWALLPDIGVAAAATMRSATHAAYRPAGSFEAVARQGHLYARYVGASAVFP